MKEEISNENNDAPSRIVHKPLAYGKKFYLGEFLAERLIQVIAFLSIGFIIAIFYYVFQEAGYAFIKEETVQEQTAQVQSIDNPQLKPEAYNSGSNDELKPESYSSDNTDELKPESYSPDNSTELKPESYSPDNSAELKPERYGDAATTTETPTEPVPEVSTTPNVPAAQTASVEHVEAKNLGVGSFISPNDYIDDKPAYIWQPISEVPKFSFIPLFVGALKVTLIGLLFAAPIAILAALFTVSYAPKWMKEIVKPAIEILAGFPSVVIGFFCLITLATVVQDLFGIESRLNSFVGGLGMALAVIPIIYTITEDALSSVPKYLKEASLALGASRWQTAIKVVLPAATPGVFAALILGFGRAFGETMIALMATGNAALTSANLFESVRTLAATIGSEMAEVEYHGVHYGVLFLIGATLFVITFSLNAIAEFYVRKRLIKKFQGQ